MSRYIDREALLEWIEAVDGCLADGTVETPTLYAQIITDIQQFPPPIVDVVEVRNGTWYHGTENGAVYAKCSACGRKMNYSCYGYAYCALCGAKMDGERR